MSPGCKFCYAETLSNRNPGTLGVWGPEGTRVLASEQMWREPIKWDRDLGEGETARVFCASLADVFEDWEGQMQDSKGRPLWVIPGDHKPDHIRGEGTVEYRLCHARARLWHLIRATPRLTWQILTKRPENIGRMMPHGAWPNVWLGTSVETQEFTWRVDALSEAPQEVPVRFVSAEPLIGPLSLWRPLQSGVIQWVIVGGESGGEARPLWLAWARNLVQECRAHHVSCFVKQLGKVAVEHGPWQGDISIAMYTLPLVHDRGHGGVMEDWPEDLRVRGFPWPQATTSK